MLFMFARQGAAAKLCRTEITEELQKEGFSFSDFSISTEDFFEVEDAAWNFSDIAHVNHLHRCLGGIFPYTKEDAYASIYLARFYGNRIPYVSVNYLSAPNRHTHFTTVFFAVVAVESVFEPVRTGYTRIITTYSVGTFHWLRWLHPFLRWMLMKNYWQPAGEDAAVRRRRGELRSWGYRLRQGPPDCAATMDTSVCNVRTGPAPRFEKEELILSKVLPRDGEFFLGRSDHWGLRLIRKGSRIFIFDRLCPHEGASLDEPPCRDGAIRCPWHGRVFHPSAELDLSVGARQERALRWHELKLESGILSVRYRAEEPAALLC